MTDDFDNSPGSEPITRRRLSANRPPQHTPENNERVPQHVADHSPPRRARRRKATAVEDVFYFPLEEIPEGSSYEWKRYRVGGQEDPFYIAQMREQGWEPVDPKKHPSYVPPGFKEPYIIRGDQILMERPIELTNEARKEQREMASRQVRDAESRLGMTPKDTMTRQHPDVRPTITKEYGRLIAVDE